MSEPQKLLLEIERLNKEIIKLKEVIENKNAHVESKNKHIARLEKIISIMKKGEPTIFDFPRRTHFTIESNRCVFALQKLSVVAITWNFLLYPFLAIVVRSVTTEVVTLRDNLQLCRHPFGMAKNSV